MEFVGLKEGKVTLEKEKLIRKYLNQFDDEKSSASQMFNRMRKNSEIIKRTDPKKWEEAMGREGAKTILHIFSVEGEEIPPVFRNVKTIELPDGRTITKQQIFSANI